MIKKSKKLSWTTQKRNTSNESYIVATSENTSNKKSILKNLVGKKIGRFTILSRAENGKNGEPRWNCLCDCGNKKIVYSVNLNHGRTLSCGCLGHENAIKANTIHAQKHTRLYTIWQNIKARCNNPKSEFYKNYGGRRITICDDWNSFISFRDWALANGYANNLFIERKNNNGNYTPENCCFASMKEQSRNRRSNRFEIYNGLKKTVAEWAEIAGLKYSTLLKRLRLGWSIGKAINTPLLRG